MVRYVPITVTDERFAPLDRGQERLCPNCNNYNWSRAYAPALFTLTKGKAIWECSYCKEQVLEHTNKRLEEVSKGPFGIPSKDKLVLAMAALLPCPVCLGIHLTPIYTDHLFLQCDLCDHQVDSHDLSDLLGSYNYCARLAASIDFGEDLVTAKTRQDNLIQVLYLYLVRYRSYKPSASFIHKVYSHISRYEAGRLAEWAAGLLNRK